jgi:hypothetical protein
MMAKNRANKMQPLSLRTTPHMRAKLEAAASENGRSLTAEIEHRLERSFDEEAVLSDLRKALWEEADAVNVLLGRPLQ